MWIPPSIPELILRVFTRKLTQKELEAQRQSGIIHSEDAKWDEKLPIVGATLSNFCVKKIAESYPILTGKVDQVNKVFKAQYEAEFAVWKNTWKEYQAAKREYDNVLDEHLQEILRLSVDTDGTDDYDDRFEPEDSEIWDPPDEPTMPPRKPPALVRAKSILSQLSATNRSKFVEFADPDKIPIDLALRTIPDEYYWKRMTQNKFPEAVVEQHGNSWRRAYIERSLREIIEFFDPYEGKWEDFQKDFEVFGKYALALELHHLIPVCFGDPSRIARPASLVADDELVGAEADEGYVGIANVKSVAQENGSDKQKSPQPVTEERKIHYYAGHRDDNSHVDLGQILPKLKRLRSLCIMFKMQEMGLTYEPRFEQFTETDCRQLGHGLKRCYQLRHFELQRSHVTDQLIKILCRKGLRYLHHLRILNLSYNELGDAGAHAIAKLITDFRTAVPATLHTLILNCCQIQRPGANSIAYALTKNKHLRKITLRLNPLHESGARAMANALMENKTLISLDLSATNMGPTGCTQFGKMLMHNQSIREIDFSSNPDITSKAAAIVSKAVHSRHRVCMVDFRACGIDIGLETTMMKKCEDNFLDSKHYEYLSDINKFPKREAWYAKEIRFHKPVKSDAQAEGSFGEEGDTEEEEAEDVTLPGPSVAKEILPTPDKVPAAVAPAQPATTGVVRATGRRLMRRKLKPFELEERRLRNLIKNNEDFDLVYESWLRGDRLDKYIEHLEDKLNATDTPLKRRHKRHRWVRKSLMEKIPPHYKLLY